MEQELIVLYWFYNLRIIVANYATHVFISKIAKVQSVSCMGGKKCMGKATLSSSSSPLYLLGYCSRRLPNLWGVAFQRLPQEEGHEKSPCISRTLCVMLWNPLHVLKF